MQAATANRYETQHFETDVIARSATVPVLVDFWAPWCGPCRFLGPIVEKLAEEADGRWILVKVNTEQQPELAARFGIRGIPNLKLFHHGAVIAELAGALPEPQLRAWIEEQLPTPARALLAEASALVERGDESAAVPLLRQALAEDPGLIAARMLLARLLVLKAPAEAKALLQGLAHLEDAEELLLLADAPAMRPDDLPDGPVKRYILQGLEAFRQGDLDGALEAWIEAVMRDKRYHGGLPRRLCVALLKLLGREHPVSQRWTKRFEMALF
ncbi:MAG: thioredoxin domain-containing protein [Flavobacteriales bacterium]